MTKLLAQPPSRIAGALQRLSDALLPLAIGLSVRARSGANACANCSGSAARESST